MGAPAVTSFLFVSLMLLGPIPAADAPDRVRLLEATFDALQGAARNLPRDSLEPQAVLEAVGRDPEKLFQWMRESTRWAPYRGVLRGPVGVLQDRLGNSLDRSLLLADLLRLAGIEAVLARGELDGATAARLLEEQALVRAPSAGESKPPAAKAARTDPGTGGEGGDNAIAGAILEAQREAEEFRRRTAECLRVLTPRLPGPPADVSGAPQEALDAIRDHWWVRMRAGDDWNDLDLLDGEGKMGKALATMQETVDPDSIDVKLLHTVKVCLVVERWEEGELTEETAVDETLIPFETLGCGISLTCYPVDLPESARKKAVEAGPEGLKAVALAAKEWMPVLQIGKRRAAANGFTTSGRIVEHAPFDMVTGLDKKKGVAGDILGGGEGEGEEPEEPAQLSALWLDFEIACPGRPSEKVRREIFDAIGPAARAAGSPELPHAGEERWRLDRGLALLTEVEIMTQAFDLAPASTVLLTLKAVLEGRQAILEFLRSKEPRKADPAAKGRPAKAAGKEAKAMERAEEILEILTASIPGSLYRLASRRSDGRASNRFIDRPNVLCRQRRWTLGPKGAVEVREMMDIATNDVGVLPGAPRGAWRARLEQGIADSIAEAEVVGGGGDPLNASEILARAEAQGVSLVAVAEAEGEAWKGLPAGGDARARMEEDLKAGFVLIAPERAVRLAGGDRFGWWRVRPGTGENLGILESGFHGTTTEKGLQDTYIPNVLVRMTRFTKSQGPIGIFAWFLRYVVEMIRWTKDSLMMYFGRDPHNSSIYRLLLQMQLDLQHWIRFQ